MMLWIRRINSFVRHEHINLHLSYTTYLQAAAYCALSAACCRCQRNNVGLLLSLTHFPGYCFLLLEAARWT